MAALNLARNVSDSLTAAGEELQNVARKVPEGVFLSQENLQDVSGFLG